MATIGAVTKGVVSKRKRIRAAGRAWLNLWRADFLQKQEKIKVEHISSHKGTLTSEQIGNDADRLANSYRLEGEASLNIITRAYWKANIQKQFISIKNLLMT